MKKLFFLLLFSGSLDSFSQVFDLRDTAHYRPVTGVIALADPPKPDTLRAELLVTFTSHRWGVAHARTGYVIMQGGEVVSFLNHQRKPFPPEVSLWGWMEEKKKRR